MRISHFDKYGKPRAEDADKLDGEHAAAFEDAGAVAAHAADVDAHHVEPTAAPTANKPLLMNASAKFPDLTIAGTLTTDGPVHSQGLKLGSMTTLTLDANGEITISLETFYNLATFEDAAADDLVKINGSTAGQLLVLIAKTTGKVVTVKDTGYLRLAGDMVLNNTQDTLVLIGYGTGGRWLELSRSNNA